jgi:hypothetical protein
MVPSVGEVMWTTGGGGAAVGVGVPGPVVTVGVAVGFGPGLEGVSVAAGEEASAVWVANASCVGLGVGLQGLGVSLGVADGPVPLAEWSLWARLARLAASAWLAQAMGVPQETMATVRGKRITNMRATRLAMARQLLSLTLDEAGTG